MLDTERIIQKAIDTFQESVAWNVKYEIAEYLPIQYRVDDIFFNITTSLGQLLDQREGDFTGIKFQDMSDVDGLNGELGDGVRAGLWLNSQLSVICRVLFYSRVELNVISSKRLKELVLAAESVKHLRIYPFLPTYVHSHLDTAYQIFIKELETAIERETEKHLQTIRASARHGFVYLIQSPTGSYKIGRTKDPDDRLKTFSVKLPFEVDYVCTIETGDMYQLERELHKKYASKRVNGEWFYLEPEDVEDIRGLAVSS